jgi:O-antigen/teichoic acid export membrane protein
MTELRTKVTRGLKWSGLAQIAQQLLQFVIYVALARLLAPEEFGLMGMVLVFIGFGTLLADLGLGAALIQRQNVENRHLSSVFWLHAAVGGLLTFVLLAASTLIANFYGKPVLKLMTVLLSFTLFFNSLSTVPRSILMRAMDFRRIFLADTTALFISGLTAVIMAAWGLGILSLVIQSLMLTILSTAIVWKLSDWRPMFIFDMGALRELSHFSFNLLGFTTLDYFISNADKVLIGRFVGASPLGIYNRAYQLMLLPVTQVSSVVTRVMFPALSVIQDDKAKVRYLYLQATRMIALVAFPVMIGLLVVARPFILSIFGEKWQGVVLILQIFCIAGLEQSIGTTLGWIYTSQGRTDTLFKWAMFAGAVRISSMILGLHWGIVGVAIGYVASGCLFLTYPGWRIAGNLINIRFNDMMRNLAQPFFCAAAMGILVLVEGLMLPPLWPQWLRLAAQTSFGLVVYTALVHLLRITAYKELRHILSTEIHGSLPGRP